MAEESIYNLIPHIPEPVVKGRMHRSTHNPTAPPSYSTFPHKEQAAGARDTTGTMMFAGRSGHMGRDVGPAIDPKQFLKAHSAPRDSLPPAQPFDRPRIAPKRGPVPTRADKPVMGLMTDKDFVHANAVEAVQTKARHRGQLPEPSPVSRPDFGKAPHYLSRMKDQIDVEKTMLADAQARRADHEASIKEQYVRQVSEDEKEELVAALRHRWEEKHRQYHALPFAQDTAMQIQRKEAIERELKEIETALGKLSRKVVVVYNDTQGPAVANWAKTQAQIDATHHASRMVNASVAAKTAAR